MATYQCPYCGTAYFLDAKHYAQHGYRATCVACGGELLVDRNGQVCAMDSAARVKGSRGSWWGLLALVVMLLAVAVPIALHVLDVVPAASGPLAAVGALVLAVLILAWVLMLFRKAGP